MGAALERLLVRTGSLVVGYAAALGGFLLDLRGEIVGVCFDERVGLLGLARLLARSGSLGFTHRWAFRRGRTQLMYPGASSCRRRQAHEHGPARLLSSSARAGGYVSGAGE